jgi:hypothetical protein
MRIVKPVRIAIWILAPIVLLCGWYAVAADYDYEMVSGVYLFKQRGEESTLVLRADRTFLQEREQNGKVDRAQGKWHRSGEGGIDFSKEFLPVSNVVPESDGVTYGEVRKTYLELIPYIVLGSNREHGPKFHRAFFHAGDIAR